MKAFQLISSLKTLQMHNSKNYENDRHVQLYQKENYFETDVTNEITTEVSLGRWLSVC